VTPCRLSDLSWSRVLIPSRRSRFQPTLAESKPNLDFLCCRLPSLKCPSAHRTRLSQSNHRQRFVLPAIVNSSSGSAPIARHRQSRLGHWFLLAAVAIKAPTRIPIPRHWKSKFREPSYSPHSTTKALIMFPIRSRDSQGSSRARIPRHRKSRLGQRFLFAAIGMPFYESCTELFWLGFECFQPLTATAS
jgi:hypothetical protein